MTDDPPWAASKRIHYWGCRVCGLADVDVASTDAMRLADEHDAQAHLDAKGRVVPTSHFGWRVPDR